MSQLYHCEKGCCTVKIRMYDLEDIKTCLSRHRRNYRKAGIFLYDPKEKRVLLVQSRGQLWGPPKGTVEIEKGETNTKCAIRELKEETGLDIMAEEFRKVISIKNKAMFYYAEKESGEVEVQQHEQLQDNDANGITWIRVDCLEECIRNGKIVLNQYGKIAFKKFLGKDFPKSDFVKVESRKKRRSRNNQ